MAAPFLAGESFGNGAGWKVNEASANARGIVPPAGGVAAAGYAQDRGGGPPFGDAFGFFPDFDFDDEDEAPAEGAPQVALEACDFLIADAMFFQWGSQEAMRWIRRASSAFELFGIKPTSVVARAVLRKRFRKLSLLTHPDKNSAEGAADAFRKLTDAMRVLSDEDEQNKLLKRLGAADTTGAGMYKPTKTKEELEKEELESALKAALKEEKESEKADKDWQRKRRGMQTVQGLEPVHRLDPRMEVLGRDDVRGLPKKRRRGEAPQWGLPEQFRPPPSAGSTGSSTASRQRPPDPRPGDTPGIYKQRPPDPRPGDAVQPAKHKEVSAAADPHMIWQLTGQPGLTVNGWQRLESTSHPGLFYYMHAATGKKVLAPSAAAKAKDHSAPPGWEKRESRSKPGTFYYVHLQTGETSAKPPKAPSVADEEKAVLLQDTGPVVLGSAAIGFVWPWQQQAAVQTQPRWPWQTA